MPANAPVCGSFKISRLRAGSAWLDCASTTSEKPSKWMPPVTSNGIATSPAPKTRLPSESQSHTIPHTHTSSPSAIPMRGKKHIM